MSKSFATAAFAAALALAASAPAAQAQRALVYCPVSIDAGGCDRIVSALKSKFADSVDRGFDGSSGTVDLRKIDLQHYAVFVVPSLADDATKQPYAVLRSAATRLHMAINGRVAVYSGAPDQGVANRADKDALIQNLVRWAADGHNRATGLVGLVAFLDLSEKSVDRYSWVRSISTVDVSADEELQAFGDITPVTTRGGDMFSASGRAVKFSNMASYGLHIGGHAAARTEVSAMGGTSSRQSILVQYSNAGDDVKATSGGSTGKVGSSGASFNISSGTSASMTTTSTTSGPTLATDKPDYLPGDTVTFSGTGWVAGDTVTITIHEDPQWTTEDRTVTAVADGTGSFTNHTFVVDQRDYGVTFTATAVANPSGLVAQTIFTDGSSTVSGVVTDAITHNPISGATVTCATTGTNPCNNPLSTTTNATGNYSLAVQFSGSSNTVQLTASATGYASSSANVGVSNTINPTQNFALTPSGPTKLAFPNAAVSGTVGQCVGPITIQTQNAVGAATNVISATTVNLATDNGSTGTAAFYDANTCASTITNISIASGNSSGTFFYKATARGSGTHTITAAATGLTSATQAETINKADQATLAVTAPTTGIFGDKLVMTASGGSGTGALTFAVVSGSTACSIISSGPDAGKLQITSGTGSCSITATKATDNDFNSATSAAQVVTISKATPVFSAVASQTITYGTATAALTGKLASGTLIPPGTVTVTLGTGGGATSQTPTLAADGTFSATFNTASLNASTTPYPVAYSFTGDNNFSAATDNTTTLTVNKANQTITFAALTDKIYGDADFAVSATATSGLTVTFSVGATDKCTISGNTVHITGAGSCTVTAAQIGDGNFNPATAAVGSALARTFTIAPKALTVTAKDASKIYGQVATFAGTDFTSSGLVGTETIGSVTLTSTGAAATATVAGSPYPIVASAATGGTFTAANYTITYANGSLTVTPKALTVTASNRAKTYGDAVTFAGTEFTTPSGALVNGDVINSVTLASPGAAATATVAGSPYAITASAAVGTGLGNYTISYTAGTLTVSAKALTITAKDASKTYGDVAVLTGTTDFTTSGLVAGESVTSVTLTSTGTAANAAVAGSPYDIVASAAVGTTLTNYTISYVNGKLTVNRRALAVTANSTSKTYGETLTFAGTEFSSSGLANSETIGSVTLTSPGAAATATVGGSPYSITASAATGGTFAANNYMISYVAGSLTVNTKSLTITASDRAKTYGDAVTFAGTEFSTPAGALVNGDAVSSVTLTSTGAAATATVAGSPYPIVASAAVGTGLGNYSITFANGSLTVSPRALAITAKDATKTYGDVAVLNGASDFTASGVVNSDAVSSVTLTSAGTPATAGVSGSPYAIVASASVGTGLANYTISYVSGSLTVKKKPLTITANNANKTYGDAVTFAGTEFTPSGLANGETVGSVTLSSSGAAATALVSASPYAIVASAATGGTFSAANYDITYNNGTLTVAPKALTITAKNASKTYGQTAALSGTDFTSSGLVNTDAVSSVTLTSPGAAPTATVAGSPYAIVPSAATGTGLGNYTISYANGSLTIGPKALTITANNRQKTYGDAVTFAGTEFTPYGLVNGETVGSVSLTSAGATATATVAGSPYSIVVSSAAGGTFAAGNYTITYTSGSLTVIPKALSVTANDLSKDYGDALTFAGTEFTSSGLTNSDAITSVTLTSAGAAANALASPPPYSIVPSNAVGTGLGNYSIGYVNGTLTVKNYAPVLVSVAGPAAPVGLGSSVTVTGNFTDHGVSGDSYIVSSTWMNGATPLPVPNVGAASYDGNAGTLSITAPSSITTGVYTVSVTVTDRFGAVSNTLTVDNYVVVYDPNAGFVTGGGWINSPVGAYTPNPSLTGKATFGFVSKYKKGQSTPDGDTEFQFQAAGFNFKSTSYDWLVIAGSKAQYKGSGTINGSGDYFFMLTAIDGSPDTFRMKVWDKTTLNVIYDNQLSASDSADPTTALGGGSIQIHAK